ncbi:MAG: hypothetical protein WCO18_00535 [bacterium]
MKEYRHSKRIEYINAQESIFKTLHGPKPITVEDIGSIQEWMTFDYINHLFGLPNDYLMTNLSITDSKYPKLTIRKYSLDKKTDLPTSIAEIQSAIKVYFAKK